MKDEPGGVRRSQDLDLVVLETRRRKGQEAMVVLYVPRAQKARRAVKRQDDLVETVVARGPEVAAPGEIERVDGCVAALEIDLELAARDRRVGLRSAGIEFVIGLPANDIGVVLVVLGHRPRDPAAMGAEHRA